MGVFYSFWCAKHTKNYKTPLFPYGSADLAEFRL